MSDSQPPEAKAGVAPESLHNTDTGSRIAQSAMAHHIAPVREGWGEGDEQGASGDVGEAGEIRCARVEAGSDISRGGGLELAGSPSTELPPPPGYYAAVYGDAKAAIASAREGVGDVEAGAPPADRPGAPSAPPAAALVANPPQRSDNLRPDGHEPSAPFAPVWWPFVEAIPVPDSEPVLVEATPVPDSEGRDEVNAATPVPDGDTWWGRNRRCILGGMVGLAIGLGVGYVASRSFHVSEPQNRRYHARSRSRSRSDDHQKVVSSAQASPSPATPNHAGGRSDNQQKDATPFYLSNPGSGKVIDIHGGRCVEGNKVQLWDGVDGAWQRWRANPDGTIESVYCAGIVLDIEEGRCEKSMKIRIGAKDDTRTEQRWRIDDDGTIANLHCKGLVLDVRGGDTTSGAVIALWPRHGAANQMWERSLLPESGAP